MFFGNHTISSQAGVQQGDPLGPFLFCLVLQILVSKINQEIPSLSLNSWCMDDGSLFGSVPDVLKAWDIIKETGSELGLFVNSQKCELILPGGHLDCFSIESSIIRFTGCNMGILGSPIGSKVHCESWVSQKLLKKLPALLDGLNRLDHLQSSFLLLLFCASFCKMVWYIRTIPPELIADSCSQFDISVIQEFEFLIGNGLPPHSILQAQLGTKLGGLGLRSSTTHAAAAYISSFFSSKVLAELFLGKEISNSFIQASLSSFNSLVDPNSLLTMDSPIADQNLLSSAIDQQSLKSLMTDLNALDKARLLSCGMPHANAWIRALPFGSNKLSCLEWQICMKRWLGIAIFENDFLCPVCEKQVMDVFGHHAVVCDCSGDRIKRHNAIRDCFFDACVAAAWGPVKEKPFLISGSSEKPADVFIPNFSSGKGLVIDTAISCPMQQKYVHNSSLIQGFTCNEYAQSIKVKNFGIKVTSEGFEYLPVVLESFGGFSDGVSSLVDRFTCTSSIRFNVNRSLSKKHFYDNISCTLMKHIARSISSRFPDFFVC